MDTTETGLIAAATRVEDQITALADTIAGISRPSDVTEALSILSRAQEAMARVSAGLAAWHGAVELGVHHSGEHSPGDPQNPGWLRAEVALEEATQYSRDAAAALERARVANQSARWFDEIREDGR